MKSVEYDRRYAADRHIDISVEGEHWGALERDAYGDWHLWRFGARGIQQLTRHGKYPSLRAAELAVEELA